MPPESPIGYAAACPVRCSSLRSPGAPALIELSAYNHPVLRPWSSSRCAAVASLREAPVSVARLFVSELQTSPLYRRWRSACCAPFGALHAATRASLSASRPVASAERVPVPAEPPAPRPTARPIRRLPLRPPKKAAPTTETQARSRRPTRSGAAFFVVALDDYGLGDAVTGDPSTRTTDRTTKPRCPCWSLAIISNSAR